METNDTPIAEQDTEQEEIDLAPTEEIINALPDNSRSHLIPTLQKIQDVYRFLPMPAMELVMDALNISKAEIYGVISFYPQMRISEPGKYIIKLCYGTACFVKGAPIIGDKINDCYHIRPGQTDDSKLFTLQTASCLGNCGAAPMAIVGEDTHGNIDPENYLSVLAEYKKDDEEAPATEEATA
jgi:NADH:ubiquinone oxidoreductase subunit E